MNISIKTIIFVLISISLLTFSKISYSQPRGCDTLTVPGWEIPWGFPKDTVFVIKAPDIIPPVSEFEPCESGELIKKNISFIHGLGGSAKSWHHVGDWTKNNYQTAKTVVDYEARLQLSFNYICDELISDQIKAGSNQVYDAFPNRCDAEDFAIAHSQGGIAARYLDMKWDIDQSGDFGIRRYYGLVTFGTPHSGAHIALTKQEHNTFIKNVASSVFLERPYGQIYDLTTSWVNKAFLGLSGRDIQTKIDEAIEFQLAPLSTGSLHTPTLDEMAPHSSTMDLINTHRSRLRKVAFYGTENSPECWKVISNITDTAAEDFPLWQAKRDHHFQSKMENARAAHLAAINDNNGRIKTLEIIQISSNVIFPFVSMLWTNPMVNQMIELEDENKYRNAAIQFLNNANTSWRYLIGSYHRDSFHIETRTIWVLTWEEKARRGHGWVSKEARFDNINSCHNHMNNLTNHVYRVRNTNITTFNSNKKVMKFFPSDGVVLVKSQIAFPGVGNRTDAMPGDNHFQMRNSEETERVMKLLYDGFYDPFFYTAR